MQGCYVDAKFMRGLKCMRISVDIPIEHSNQFLKAFGAPDGVNPVPVAIARLGNGAYAPSTETQSEPVADPVKETQGAVEPRKYTRSQIAALKCQDNDFRMWLAGRHRSEWIRACSRTDDAMDASGAVDLTMKDVLGIKSKRELDSNPVAGAAWDKLLTDFDLRNTAR